MRRLIESMDKISEAGPKGLQRPGLELGPEMGGGGGAGGISGSPSVTSMARLPTLTKVVKPAPPAVWRNRAGQTTTAPGTTVSQPLPPGVTPSTAGAGRGTAPVTRPPLGKDAGAVRMEPEIRQPVGRNLSPEQEKKERRSALKKSAALHGAIAAGLYPWSKDKTSGAGAAGGEQRYEVELYNPDDHPDTAVPPTTSDTAVPTTIDLPRVGPQGPDSPFYVLPGSSSEELPPSSAAKPTPAPAKPAPAPTPAPAKPAPTPAPAKPAPAPAPAPTPAPAKPAPAPTPPTPAKPTATGTTGTATGNAAGAGSEDEQIERNLRRMGVIKETFSQRLLNDFINFVETKNKSKAK